MSSRSLGNQRELRVRNMLRDIGYRASRISVSGWNKQKEEDHKDDLGIPADVIGDASLLQGWPHVWIECGGSGKRLRVAFEKMRPLPAGTIAIAALMLRKQWVFYREDGQAYATLEGAIHESPEYALVRGARRRSAVRAKKVSRQSASRDGAHGGSRGTRASDPAKEVA